MVWCGVEEPLRPNRQLFAYDEENDTLRLANFGVSRLARYSFTHLEEGVWPGLLNAIADQAVGTLQWVLVWKHELTGPLRMRSKIRVSRLRHQGFCVNVSGAIGVAPLRFSGTAPSSFHPCGLSGHPAGDGTIIIVDAEEDAGELLLGQLQRPTMVQAAVSSRFAPSREFLLWMTTLDVRVLYLSYDHLEHPGLVVVTRRQVDMGRLVSLRLLNRIERGDLARVVWTGR